jgi:arylsulfatase A-like enzyme
LKRKPNILFILTDDQRFDTIRALGNHDIHTPNMDRLVNQGFAFTHAHIMGGTHPAVCMPSRAMLLTGRTLFHLHGEGTGKGSVIPEEHKTLPETFREAGYTTHHIGKWHQDRKSFNRSFDGADCIFGFTKGWYKEYGGHWNVAIHDYDPTGTYPHETGYMLAEDKVTRHPIGFDVGGVHSSELFADAAVQFIEQYNQENPYFLYLSFVAPHDPRQSTSEFEAMYPPERMLLPPNFMERHPFDNGELTVRDEQLESWPRQEENMKEHLAQYYAMISHLDQQLGRVLDALEQSGQAENTIIVFTGDNGLAVGQHGLMGKQNLYEHSLRVPLILTGPGIQSGQRSDALCYLLDIYPTLCELTGIPKPLSVEGQSFLPVMEGSQGEHRSSLFCGYRNVQRSLRSGPYKLIEYVVKGVRTTQLFHLEQDPWEMHNLSDDPAFGNILDQLRKQLIEWQGKTDDPLLSQFTS